MYQQVCIFFCSYVHDKGYLRYLRMLNTNATDRLINRVSIQLTCTVCAESEIPLAKHVHVHVGF